MAEYIRREDILDIASQYCIDDDGSCSKVDVDLREMLNEIEALPSADVQPVKQWVKLHDKHPDTKGFYLVCDQYGECEVAEYIPDIKSWFVHNIKGEIQYWISLPEPPKDGDAE